MSHAEQVEAWRQIICYRYGVERAQRRCSFCREYGHNIARCLKADPANYDKLAACTLSGKGHRVSYS